MSFPSLFFGGSVRPSAMSKASDGRYPSTGIYNAKSVLEYCRVGIGVPPRRYWHVLGSSCPCFLHRKLLVSARLVNIVGS